MTMSLSRLVAVALVSSFSLMTFAQTPSGDGETIRYQVYNSTAEVLMRVADQVFCEKYDLNCEPVFVPSSSQGLQAVRGGSLDVAYLGTDFGIRAASNGSGIKILSGASERVNLQLVLRTDLEWPNLSAGFPEMFRDLEGKTIGVSGRGASTEIMLGLIMRDAGYDLANATVVGVGGPVTALGALRSRRVDAVMLFQPLPAICAYSEVCMTALDLTKSQRPTVTKQFDGAATTIWADASALKSKERAFVAYKAALRDAAKWLAAPENFDKALGIVEGYIEMHLPNAPEIVREGLEEQIRNTKTTLSKRAVDAYIELLSQRDLLGRNQVLAGDLIWKRATLAEDK